MEGSGDGIRDTLNLCHMWPKFQGDGDGWEQRLRPAAAASLGGTLGRPE